MENKKLLVILIIVVVVFGYLLLQQNGQHNAAMEQTNAQIASQQKKATDIQAKNRRDAVRDMPFTW